MRTVQTFSRVLYIICRGIAAILLLVAAYAAIVLLTVTGDQSSLLVHVSGNHSIISYPFTEIPFLHVYYDGMELFLMFSALISYAVFAMLLGNVFWVFKQDKLFTVRSVQHLKRFYLANIIVPVGYLLIALLSGVDPQAFIVLTILHGVIGVFSWLMSKIFNEGLTLQEEQDFTL